MRPKRRRPRQKVPRAYFIKRKSLLEGDDSQYFHDDGRRVYFDKALWARWFIVQFKPEQDAKIVSAAVLDTDIPCQKFIERMLPSTVSIDEYFKALEATVAARKSGKEPSKRVMRRLGWR